MSETITSSLIRKDDREAVIGLFTDLAGKQELTPQILVNLARDEKHVLHRYFEWDSDIAAEKYRQMQARQLIQSVKVRIVKAPESVVSVRAILSVPPDAAHGQTRPRYALASALADDTDAQQRIKDQAIVEMSRMRKKYDALGHLPEFAAIFGSIDSLTARAA